MAPPRQSVSKRLLERRKVSGGCWIYTGAVSSDGYGHIGVGRGHSVRAHRAAYQEFVGPIPFGMWVLHKCDTPLCINPKHLFLGTPKDNTQDMIKKGRAIRAVGESHKSAKLTDAEVKRIRYLRSNGISLLSIASRYGVTFQHISAIALRKVRNSI